MMVGTPRTPIVESVALRKVFKDFWMRTKALAVDAVDFEIYPNEIFGLLGPNGSGKSTIIKMILGLLHKTSGRLTVFGKPPSDVMTKKYIGFLPEESYLYRFLNPKETLDYYGKLFGLSSSVRKRRIDELLEMIGLTQVAHRPLGEFSKGMTRRIGIAQALINDPDFLILDEPTSGLDPIGTRQVKDLLLELRKRGKTILLSSHLLADVEDVCDRMVVLYGGKIRAEGTVDELLADTESTVIKTGRLRDDTISKIEEVLEEVGEGIVSVQAPRQRLEQLFLDIVERAREEQVHTSGALDGGDTAAFLKAEDAEGDELIDTLITGEEQKHKARIVEEQAPAAAHDGPAEDVLADLVKEKPVEPPPRSRVEGPAPAAPQDVDSSLIDSLMDEEDSPEKS
jgi:ABC-2 type transport system ATP-binding protein